MMMDLILKNLKWQHADQMITGDLRINQGFIKDAGKILSAKKSEQLFNLENHFVYPGLTNAHDHLEMNLYPKLGTPPYKNYVDWANDIYKPSQSPLLEIEKVPIQDRLLWGGLKNLISGVTTVVHHNPWHHLLGKEHYPVHVLKKMSWAHSLVFQKNLNRTFPNQATIPFIIHAAEGIDATSQNEVHQLHRLGLIKSNTVIIHGVGLDEGSIKQLAAEQASLVWCPASNFYMFNKTAPIEKLNKKIKIALGSDSTLTGSATLLDEIQLAVQTGLVNSREIFCMVTQAPAEIFHLPDPIIGLFKPANLFVAPIKHENYFENLLHIRPSDITLVVKDGAIRLIDQSIASQNHALSSQIKIQGQLKFVAVDVTELKKRLEKKIGTDILKLNPLWNLIDV